MSILERMMMSDRKKWIKTLTQLWLKNFRVSNFYRRAMEAVTDPALKNIFVKLASKRAQLAFEINRQIQLLGGPPAYYENSGEEISGSTISIHLPEENRDIIIEKSMNTERDSLAKYTKALSSINEGTIREILIRHRALIGTAIKDLRTIANWENCKKNDSNLKTN